MMNKQIALFEVIQDFLVSLTLTLAALLVSKQNITGLLLLTETVFAWIVNLVIGFTVPQKKICDRVCAKLKLKKTFAFLVTMFLIVLMNVVGISACVVLKNVGFNKMYFNVWISLFPILMGVGYVAALIWYPVTNWIVSFFCKDRSKV